jgi:hypothetical protein
LIQNAIIDSATGRGLFFARSVLMNRGSDYRYQTGLINRLGLRSTGLTGTDYRKVCLGEKTTDKPGHEIGDEYQQGEKKHHRAHPEDHQFHALIDNINLHSTRLCPQTIRYIKTG